MLLVWLLFQLVQSNCPTLRSICLISNGSQKPPSSLFIYWSTSTILIFPPASLEGDGWKGQNPDHFTSAFALQQPTSNTHFVCDHSPIPLPRSNPPQLPARCTWPQNAGQPMNSETPAPKGGLTEKRSFSLCCWRLITRLPGLSRPCGAKRGTKNILCEQKSVQRSHCKDQRVTRFTIAETRTTNFPGKIQK